MHINVLRQSKILWKLVLQTGLISKTKYFFRRNLGFIPGATLNNYAYYFCGHFKHSTCLNVLKTCRSISKGCDVLT